MKFDILKYLDLLKETFDSPEIIISKNDANTLLIAICTFTNEKIRVNQFALLEDIILNASIDVIDNYFNKAIEELKNEIFGPNNDNSDDTDDTEFEKWFGKKLGLK